ncbi:hypothetical protein EGT73_19245 [Acinetobacter johnsonii]|uniref:Integrase catalytic domain-containing protein n=1 Tax=Acinetobacter johnsonii TaxID=40214 RepID=A0A3R9FJN8_ACIJO|nr:hypothetical protein EGT73_19245 [Acinetobacter johnsonii]
MISRVIRISLFYQNPTCFFSAYFLKHHLKYIELFYNHRRIQKGLGFKTPNQMAEDFYKLAA